jgi:uncharacterized RDD family membrane protein YckC
MAYVSAQPTVRVTGRRVVATIVDGIVLSVIGRVVAAIFGFDFDVTDRDLTRLATGGNLILLVVAVLYYVLMEGYLGRTVGKMATGIRVVDEETGRTPPGAGKAILRTIFRLVDGLLGYLVGFIVVLCNQRRRRIGDMVARTLVVRG